MSKPRLFAAEWPLVLVEWPAEVDVQDVRDHFEEMALLLDARRGKLAIIVDGTEARVVQSTLRARAAEGISAIAARAASRIIGVAYVAPSIVIRGAVTAIHWIARPPFPSTTVATRREALEWAHARIRASGLAASGAECNT